MSVQNVYFFSNGNTTRAISRENFFYYFEKAALKGREDSLKEMMAHPWFDELDSIDLYQIACETASLGHSACLRLLLSSKRLEEFDQSIVNIASCAIEKGHTECLQDLMANPRFRSFLYERRDALIKTAVENGRHHCLELLLAADWMNDMSSKKVGKMAHISALHGYHSCLQMLIGSPQFQDVESKLLGRLFSSAVFCGRKDSLKLVFNSGKFQEISKKDITIALEMGMMTCNEKPLMKAFIKSKWLPMGLGTIGKIAFVLAQKGRWVTYLKASLK